MTPQEIFDRSVAGVMKQGRPSVRAVPSNADGYGCVYRGPNGLKCAAGHLIDDEHYNAVWDDGNSASQNAAVWPAIAESCGLPHTHVSDRYSRMAVMIRDLQKAHDDHARAILRAGSPKEFGKAITDWRNAFERAARDVAVRYDLSVAILESTPWGEVQFGGVS
jgi:hypothetical protein